MTIAADFFTDTPDSGERIKATWGNSVVEMLAGHALTAAEVSAGLALDSINAAYLPGDIRRYGTNTTPGVTDMTAVFVTAFELGGEITIPDGDYLIAGTGADSGGVGAVLTRSLRVKCGPNARFLTDSLDNDMFRFVVPTGGAGLPADGIDFEWIGGTFDQRNQKNSTVIPFIANYPATNAGSSATCDALSIRLEYTVGPDTLQGGRSVTARDATFYAGDHWESAGGDSGVFIGTGAKKQRVSNCTFIGCRDLGVYFSSGSGDRESSAVADDNRFINCFHGVSAKRTATDIRYVNNYVENCVRGFLINPVGASPVAGRVSIRGNTGRNCGTFVDMQFVTGYDISDNHFTTLGALLEDGTTVEPAVGCEVIALEGCTRGLIKDNTCIGIQLGVAAAYAGAYRFILADEYDDDGTPVDSTANMFINNIGVDLRAVGSDGGGDLNSWIDNCVYNAATLNGVLSIGANSFERRVIASTMARHYTNPVGFPDGTVSAPAIYRSSAATIGLRFGASFIGLSMSSTDSIRADNDTTAGNTRLLVYDNDNAGVSRVSVGAADSGGAGFKVLRIEN